MRWIITQSRSRIQPLDSQLQTIQWVTEKKCFVLQCATTAELKVFVLVSHLSISFSNHAHRQHTAQRTCYCSSVLSYIKKDKKCSKGKQSCSQCTTYLRANEHSEQAIELKHFTVRLVSRTVDTFASGPTDKDVYSHTNYFFTIHSTWTSYDNYFNIPLYSTVKLNNFIVKHENWHLTTEYLSWFILGTFVKNSYCAGRFGPTRGAFYYFGVILWQWYSAWITSVTFWHRSLLHCQCLLISYVLPVISGVCDH